MRDVGSPGRCHPVAPRRPVTMTVFVIRPVDSQAGAGLDGRWPPVCDRSAMTLMAAIAAPAAAGPSSADLEIPGQGPSPGGNLVSRRKRDRNVSRSTTARSIRPEPITVPRASVAETRNTSRRPSTSVSSAVTVTSTPTGLAARCSSLTTVPTEVCPGGSPSATAATVASSARASSRGVPARERPRCPSVRRCPHRSRRSRSPPAGRPQAPRPDVTAAGGQLSAAYPPGVANKSAASAVIAVSFRSGVAGRVPRTVGDRWGA